MQHARITTIQKTGSSLCVIVPANICRELSIMRGDQVVIAVYDERTLTVRRLLDEEILQLKPPYINHE